MRISHCGRERVSIKPWKKLVCLLKCYLASVRGCPCCLNVNKDSYLPQDIVAAVQNHLPEAVGNNVYKALPSRLDKKASDLASSTHFDPLLDKSIPEFLLRIRAAIVDGLCPSKMTILAHDPTELLLSVSLGLVLATNWVSLFYS